jgi:hypothetical protein
MNAKRPTNSELRLARLEVEDAERTERPGILELFHRTTQPDEDPPSPREDEAETPEDGPS